MLEADRGERAANRRIAAIEPVRTFVLREHDLKSRFLRGSAIGVDLMYRKRELFVGAPFEDSSAIGAAVRIGDDLVELEPAQALTEPMLVAAQDRDVNIVMLAGYAPNV